MHVYADGSVHLNHGGTEMGQGLFTKVAQVVAEELQVDIDRIKITASDTSKVPNASATAASSGADLNGKAAQRAARKIKRRLTRFAAEHFGVPESAVKFDNNQVIAGSETLAFAELARLAWFARTSLSATGFYKTPKIRYDRSTFSGRPFYYYAYGAAVSEVIIDTLTGEHRTLRVDILHDCGQSLNPAIDIGQIEGGFVQGMGWLTSEELWWDEQGALGTHAPSTYKIPTSSDVPDDFRVEMLESAANREKTVFRSKAVGEPPLMLSLSVFLALRDAVAAARGDAPGAPELRALRQRRRRSCGRLLRVSRHDARALGGPHEAAYRAGERMVAVTVAGIRGSAPREVGARDVGVANVETFGSIGGGQLEYLCTRNAVAVSVANARCRDSRRCARYAAGRKLRSVLRRCRRCLVRRSRLGKTSWLRTLRGRHAAARIECCSSRRQAARRCGAGL